MKTEIIRFRIEEDLKKEFQEILDRKSMDMSKVLHKWVRAYVREMKEMEEARK